jgi:RNA polymerase sigma factor (sigma-70 family)
MPPPPTEVFASRLFLGPAMRAQPDRRLVTLVREGYEAAFEEIVRRYGRTMTRYAAAIVGSRSEDVAQDAFSKALTAIRRDDAEIELRPWLYRIVRNTALNDLRDRPAAAAELAETIVGGRTPAEVVEERERLSDLITRLQALPEPQRVAIVMRELEGLGHDEIAAALGLSGGAARQAIFRARAALREGAGMLVPLPLLRALLDGIGPGAAESAAGAAGVGSAAGVGVALKATAATVLVAGAVGVGVAVKGPERGPEQTTAPAGADRATADPTPEVAGNAGSGQVRRFASRTLASRSPDEGRSADRGSGGGRKQGSRSEPGRLDDPPSPTGAPVHRPVPSGREQGRPENAGPRPAGGERGLDPGHRPQVGDDDDDDGAQAHGEEGPAPEHGGDDHSGSEGTESGDGEESSPTDDEHVEGSGGGHSSGEEGEVVDSSTPTPESSETPVILDDTPG